jgi:Flp pilus assembly protein TadD
MAPKPEATAAKIEPKPSASKPEMKPPAKPETAAKAEPKPVAPKPESKSAPNTEAAAVKAESKTHEPEAKAEEHNASSLHTHGRELIQKEKFPEAITALNEAIQLDPSMPLALNARGYAHFRLKQLTLAIADFDQAIKLDPKYANAYLNRGTAKRAAGDKTGGDADMAKARELTAAKK